MTLDSDFIVMEPCVGRGCLSRAQRLVLDLVCRLSGHLLWRTGSVRANPDGSLDVCATYCRRCFKGGYVRGDYAR